MCIILNTHFAGPLQLKEFNFSYLFLSDCDGEVHTSMEHSLAAFVSLLVHQIVITCSEPGSTT